MLNAPSAVVPGGQLINPEMFEFVPERAAVEAVAEYARRARSMGEGVADNVKAIHGTWKNLDESVRISAAADLPEKFGPIAAAGERRGEALRDSADAMDRFVTDMEDPHADLQRVIQDANAFRASIPGGMVEIDAEDQFNPMVVTSQTIWGSPLGTATVPAAGARLQIHWYQHVPSIERNRALHTQADAIMEQIREAITRLNDRLAAIAAGFDLDRGKIPESARATLALLNKAGLDQVQDMNAQKIGDVLAGELRDVAESGGTGPQFETDVREMLRLLEQYGDDQHVMGVAFATLGGVATTKVLTKLADRRLPDGRIGIEENLAAAQAVRAGLSVGSTTWTDADADAFADQLMEGAVAAVPDQSGHAAAVSFLFSNPDQDPMSAALTIAMADRIDALERETGQPWKSETVGGLLDLSAAEWGRDAAKRLNDPAARILQTLGHYPDEALAWLGEEDRITYWYRQRDSSQNATGDGYEGVAALWAGALQATGGPSDADSYLTDEYDNETWENIATLNTYAMRGLAENDTFLPENVSDLGSVQLASGLKQVMPQLVDNPIHASDRALTENTTTRVAFLDADPAGVLGSGRPVVAISRAHLGALLAGATVSEESATIVRDSVQQAQLELIVMAKEQLIDPDRALESFVQIQAVTDGAERGGEAGEAHRRDEATDAKVKIAGQIADEIPVPGLGKLTVTLGDPLADWVQGKLQTELKTQLKGSIKDGLADLETFQKQHKAEEDQTVATLRVAGKQLARQIGSDVTPGEIESQYDAFHDDVYGEASGGSAPK